jgi:hypothetical protein
MFDDVINATDDAFGATDYYDASVEENNQTRREQMEVGVQALLNIWRYQVRDNTISPSFTAILATGDKHPAKRHTGFR